MFTELLLLLLSGLTIWSVVDRYNHRTSETVHHKTDDVRSSNFNYVMAVRDSMIWTEVRKRSRTIETRPRLDGLEDKSPENLSDEDLAKLKRACHDGLKCVAVDQLLVLKSYTESTDTGSKVTVRMAITRITNVLTKYTAEHDEKTYRYEEVSESDDATKVNGSVTAIVEDNRELCRIPDGDGGTYTMVRAEHSDSRGARGGDAEHDASTGAVEQPRDFNLQEYAAYVEKMYAEVFTRFVKNRIEIFA